MLHIEVLTKEAQELFPKLSDFRNDFYLAGGTALALQIGHRISVDFDFFSPNPIKKTQLAKVEATYENTPIEILINNSRELTLLVSGVKHTFLHYPFPVLLPFEKSGPIDLLSTKEILATKAYSIGRRGTLKDYVDLYCGMNREDNSLEEIIELARRKYPEAFNDRLFLEQTVYLDDVEEETLVMLDRAVPTKMELVDFFSKRVSEIQL